MLARACAFLCCSHRTVTVDIETDLIETRIAKLEMLVYNIMREQGRLMHFIDTKSIETIEIQINDLQSRLKNLEGRRRRFSHRVFRENPEQTFKLEPTEPSEKRTESPVLGQVNTSPPPTICPRGGVGSPKSEPCPIFLVEALFA